MFAASSALPTTPRYQHPKFIIPRINSGQSALARNPGQWLDGFQLHTWLHWLYPEEALFRYVLAFLCGCRQVWRVGVVALLLVTKGGQCNRQRTISSAGTAAYDYVFYMYYM
jgi:hypothetical protein